MINLFSNQMFTSKETIASHNKHQLFTYRYQFRLRVTALMILTGQGRSRTYQIVSNRPIYLQFEL